MKVTDAMVERACLRDQVSEVIDLDRRHMRAVLEAALACEPEPLEVPEYRPGAGGLSGPEALRLSTGYERLKKRAEAAEAKLEKVRAWRERYGLPQEGSDELDAILDEAP